MRKTLLTIAFLMYGTVAFGQAPIQQPEVPIPAPVQALPPEVRVLILEQRVAVLEALVAHIHNEDIEQIFQWLKFFKLEYDRVHSQTAEPLTRDRTEDKF